MLQIPVCQIESVLHIYDKNNEQFAAHIFRLLLQHRYRHSLNGIPHNMIGFIPITKTDRPVKNQPVFL